jgi:glucosamine-6-phosphate deaminase
MLLKSKKDKLTLMVFNNRQSLAEAAAMMVGEKIKYLLSLKRYINIIFAAAPSQNEFLNALVLDRSIDWSRINAFHMDEYLGLPEDASQLFGNFLRSRLFDRVPFKSVNFINAKLQDVEQECDRYTELLNDFPPDIVCMGIGENAHIAFNDPGVANFSDPVSVKMVELDMACMQQQVNDGCFNSLNEVPTHALTLTIPSLMRASFIYCIVPGETKAAAVWHTLNDSINEQYPSTILRNHDNAILFVDSDSYNKSQTINL